MPRKRKHALVQVTVTTDDESDGMVAKCSHITEEDIETLSINVGTRGQQMKTCVNFSNEKSQKHQQISFLAPHIGKAYPIHNITDGNQTDVCRGSKTVSHKNKGIQSYSEYSDNDIASSFSEGYTDTDNASAYNANDDTDLNHVAVNKSKM